MNSSNDQLLIKTNLPSQVNLEVKESANSKICEEEGEKNKLNLANILYEVSEKYIYHFDVPDIKEYGYVHIKNNQIVIYFPERNPSTAITNGHEGFQRTLQLYLNRTLIFDSQWLPLYTNQDWYRIMDMLYKCYQEYLKKNIHVNSPSIYSIEQHHESVTVYNTNFFDLHCVENFQNTIIKLDTYICDSKSKLEDHTLYCHTQIYLGMNLLFCSQLNLKHFDANTVNFIVAFILSKFIKY